MKTLISFFGSQSTGKTTATLELTNILKKNGLSANCWTDIPRECPLPFNQEGNSNTQFYISSHMTTRTLELLNIYDYVVTDRTALDCVAYEIAQQAIHTREYLWTYTATQIMNYQIDFLKKNNCKLLRVVKGWPHKMELGRTTHNEFNELSIRAFDDVYEAIRDSLDILDVDLTKPLDNILQQLKVI